MMLNNNLSHFWGSIYEKKFFYPNLSTAKGQLVNRGIQISLSDVDGEPSIDLNSTGCN